MITLKLTEGEIRSILGFSQANLDCERSAVHQFPESAEAFRQQVRNWKEIRRKLRASLKGRKK